MWHSRKGGKFKKVQKVTREAEDERVEEMQAGSEREAMGVKDSIKGNRKVKR